jgi:DNA-binding MarR family transcriptional regulator
MAADIAFAPLPARAISDQRLTGLHFRVLAAVAMHDRLASRRGKGGGCWAGNKTLAAECGCHLTNLSTAITELGRYGYLESHPHPLNRRQRVLNVVYNDHDIAFTKAANSLPTGKQSSPQPEPTVCPPANETGHIVCPLSKNDRQNQSLSPSNIFSETGRYSEETENDSSAEAARATRVHSVGEWLARTERLLKKGTSVSKLSELYLHLENLHGELEYGTSEHGWTQRLLEWVGDALHVEGVR